MLSDLHRWYAAQCDGDWEHTFGVRIGTLDNPGWTVEIDLFDTRLEDVPFTPVRRGDADDEDHPGTWIDCKVEDHKFIAYAGRSQLEAILQTFLAWAKSLPNWLEPVTEPEIAARNDRRFWAALAEETGPETCRHAGCERKQIGQSVLCREHHFIEMKGRPYSQGG